MTNEHFTFSFQPITKAWKQNKKKTKGEKLRSMATDTGVGTDTNMTW